VEVVMGQRKVQNGGRWEEGEVVMGQWKVGGELVIVGGRWEAEEVVMGQGKV
jgi:hypothetical protein